MPEIDGYSLVFPVVSGVLHPNGVDLNIKTLIGTSFYIGQGFYLTAGHVIQNALEYDITALGITKSNTPWNAIKIEAYEIHEGIDIAVFRANHEASKAYPWDRNIVGGLIDISAAGYPHGLDTVSGSIFIRGFKGYIITRRPYHRLTRAPLIYELSFPCPRGISGAFILNETNGRICGVVIGSDKSELDLHYVTEEIVIKGGNNIYHKTETSTYGIAVASSSILECEFSLLGGKLDAFLLANNLLE